MKLVRLVPLALILVAAIASAQSQGEWKAVEDAMGRSGQPQPDGTMKFGMPRKDLNVTLDGTQIKPGLALGAWADFKGSGNNSMVMGDLVLTEDEVEPVMLKLQQSGVQITALHNHLLGESPHVMYMHIEGHGEAARLAASLHDALALTKTPPATPASATPPAIDFDTAQVDSAMGRKGKNNGGIYQFAVPRAEKITDDGMEVPPSMGVATGINFQPTGNGNAAITGDFVLLGSEVNPVMQTLRENGILVTAVHSHMLMENPRLYFMHFWANANAVQLAKGLRAALDKTNSAK
ncbi:MAG TPA: DUF1259 domain-containing protein [Terriglobales bacterium]|nr:DUF1259 domain-containing protein [Terriglobales bacterium]